MKTNFIISIKFHIKCNAIRALISLLSTRNVVTKSSKSRKSLNTRITRRLAFKRYFKLPRVIQANLPFAEFANSPSTIRSIIDCAFFIFPRGLCTGLDPRMWLRGRQDWSRLLHTLVPRDMRVFTFCFCFQLSGTPWDGTYVGTLEENVICVEKKKIELRDVIS